VLQEEYKVNDSIFTEPIIINTKHDDSLTRKDKLSIISLRNRLNVYFEKKFK
jgi:hypothetical protein